MEVGITAREKRAIFPGRRWTKRVFLLRAIDLRLVSLARSITGMAQHITPTAELLDSLVNAQANHLIELLQQGGPWGDDSGDDMTGALDCMVALHAMSSDQEDLEALGLWLNTPDDDCSGEDNIPTTSGSLTRLGYMGCDGICPALYALDCPALPKER